MTRVATKVWLFAPKALSFAKTWRRHPTTMRMFSVPFSRGSSGRKSGGGGSGKRDDRPFVNGDNSVPIPPPKTPPHLHQHRQQQQQQQQQQPHLQNSFIIYDDEIGRQWAMMRSLSNSNPGSPKGSNGNSSIMKRNPFQRSRSSSTGRGGGAGGGSNRRSSSADFTSCDGGGLVWATNIPPASQQQPPQEPIYSEPTVPPLPPQQGHHHHLVRAAERTQLRLSYDGASNGHPQSHHHAQSQSQLSSHIYEYLVSRRSDASTQSANRTTPVGRTPASRTPAGRSHPRPLYFSGGGGMSLPKVPKVNSSNRRGSLTSSSSPSSGSSNFSVGGRTNSRMAYNGRSSAGRFPTCGVDRDS